MTVKEFKAVLDLVDEKAYIEFSTEPGVSYDIGGFNYDDDSMLWVELDTADYEEYKKR